jgi:putative ABC transport system substrate-binding protein
MDKFFVIVFAFIAVPISISVVFPADAQQTRKVPRIGYLSAGAATGGSQRIEAFRQGLHALGYVEGKDIAFE